MKAKQEDFVKAREKQLAKKDAEARLVEKQKADKKLREKMRVGSLLSDFNYSITSFYIHT